jgi:transcriptional regulator with XRE-family HTH domain
VENNFLRLVGVKIRDIRKSKGLSQENLAELCGLHINYIGGLERGERNVTLLNLEKVSDALKVSVSDFFSYLHKFERVDGRDVLLNELINLLLTRNEKDIRFATRLLKDLYQTYSK